MSVRLRCRPLLAALLAGLVAVAPAGAWGGELVVSAASSLTQAFRELAPAFEAQNPGTRLLLNFGASDALLAQIARGAPADVFASADQETMDRAEADRRLVPGTRRDFAGNALVVVTPAGGPPLKSLADLQRPEVRRIALGNPSGVPAGRYARAALEAAQLWTMLEPKAVFAQNVRQALDYVARGEVEAGFVYASDAAAQGDKVRLAFAVATPTPIRYPIAVVADGPDPQAARRFVDFVRSPQAQAVLARHGFTKP